jgi:hypothetical protein
MSLYDKIMELFEEEINQRIVSIMNEYVTIISKKHGISLDLLLKDIPDTFSGTICKGTKTDGRRCTFKGARNGYCKHHSDQHNRLNCMSIARTNIHTHGPEQPFVHGCPGCERSKELIDLSTMIGNE